MVQEGLGCSTYRRVRKAQIVLRRFYKIDEVSRRFKNYNKG